MEIRPILSALLRSKTGAVLVAAQVALTLAILCNALFVVNARLHTSSRPTGVDEDAVFQIFYIGAGEVDDPAAMQQRDLEALRAIPGVVAAAATNSMPLSTSGSGTALTTDPLRRESGIGATVFFSADSLVDALGLQLVEGRDFLPTDGLEWDGKGELKPDAVILTRHLAKFLFPDAPTAVGEIVYLGSGPDAQPMRVVGVVHTLMSHVGQNSDNAYLSCILPVRLLGNNAHYAVRTEPSERARAMAEAEKALGTLRSDRVINHHRTMNEIRERRYRPERAGAGILIAVTIGLLLVTASGIVGVASLWVNQRRKQIGVRRALGARRGDIMRYFLVENALITTGGIVLGLLLAIALNQLLVGLLELGRLPIEYVVAGMLVMWALGISATLGPAWRAAAVPPAIATRST
jgi:putative ABC transport system permease protein